MDYFCKAIRVVMVLFIIAIVVFAATDVFASESESQPLPLPPKNQHSTPTAVVADPDKPFDQSKWSYITLADEVQCMALNIYFEARDQSRKGQLAVGLVTINRVLSKHYPDSVCDVVWQQNKNKKGKLVAQFSWTLDGLHDNPQEIESWIASKVIAESLLDEGSLFNLADFTDGSTHYHANYITPFWSDSLTQTITVGDHLFYTNSPVAKDRSSKL